MIKIRRVAAVAVVLMLLMTLFSCAGKKNEALTVNIAYFPNITHAQALVLQAQNTLKGDMGETVNVAWHAFNAGPSEIEALMAGDIDIGYIGPVPAVNGYVQSKGDLRIIAGASNGGSVLVVRGDSQIQTVSELGGKTVAVPQLGNTQHLSLLKLLTANGLAPMTSGGSVTINAASNSDIPNLMNQKAIDAALVPEPWGSIMEQNDGARVLLDYDQIDTSGVPATAVVIVRKDFLEAHRDIVEKFIKAHKQATTFISENTAEAKKMVNAQIEAATQKTIDAAILDRAFARLKITYDIPKASIMDFALVAVDQQLTKSMPDEQIIDSSFIG